MQVFLEALMNPGDMTGAQWLLMVIILIVVLGSLVFIWRLYRIILTSRKQPYKPNIGLKRTVPGAVPRSEEVGKARQTGPGESSVIPEAGKGGSDKGGQPAPGPAAGKSGESGGQSGGSGGSGGESGSSDGGGAGGGAD